MTDNIRLPELPAGFTKHNLSGHDEAVFTDVQMNEYARAAVLADRERMKAELDALLKDKARLDKGSILIRVSNGYGGVNEHHYSGKDLRESIDAARSEGDEK